MSPGHNEEPRLPCILGSPNHEASFRWQDVSLTLDEIHNIQVAAEKKSLIVFLTDADLEDAVSSDVQQRLPRALSFPSEFKSKLCVDASGFFVAEENDSTEHDAGGYRTAFRFLIKHNVNLPSRKASSASIYRWKKFGFVTFHPSAESFTVFCFGLSDDARDGIRRRAFESKRSKLQGHPLSIHVLILKHIVEDFNFAVWSWRDVLRDLETSRTQRASGRNFNHMHEIARHLIHSTEMLTTALSVVECMMRECDSARSGMDDQASLACLRELEFISSLMTALLHRSTALEKRMDNEIALSFHANAQHDTSIASQIARASQHDGRTTKGISILGMLFLPGTYISAIFSMSFFHFTPSDENVVEQWTVSPKFWLYWVVTIPVTALTVGAWIVFQKWYSSSTDSGVNDVPLESSQERSEVHKTRYSTLGSYNLQRKK